MSASGRAMYPSRLVAMKTAPGNGGTAVVEDRSRFVVRLPELKTS